TNVVTFGRLRAVSTDPVAAPPSAAASARPLVTTSRSGRLVTSRPASTDANTVTLPPLTRLPANIVVTEPGPAVLQPSRNGNGEVLTAQPPDVESTMVAPIPNTPPTAYDWPSASAAWNTD